MHEVAEGQLIASAQRGPLFGRERPVHREERDELESIVVARPATSGRRSSAAVASERVLAADDASNHRLEMWARTAAGTTTAPKNNHASVRNRPRKNNAKLLCRDVSKPADGRYRRRRLIEIDRPTLLRALFELPQYPPRQFP